MNTTEINKILIDELERCTKELHPFEFRRHLGLSGIGEECRRKIWYDFRWVKKENLKPSLLRLFEFGHFAEEAIFLKYLTAMGCNIELFDPETGKQFTFSTTEDHVGGSCDGIGYLPEFVGINEKILFEFKTHNDNSFTKLKVSGVKVHKPEHYAQMNSYGYLSGLKYALYCAYNKNNSEMYLEFIPLNYNYGKTMIDKANSIVLSNTPPPKLHENSSFWKCKMCSKFDVCHGNAQYDKNCRSCVFSTPVQNGQWVCDKYQVVIPDVNMKSGCDDWEPNK